MFQWMVLALIPMLLVTGCGDLEPEMQDTRTVILDMDYNQKSSSRSSSSVSASDLIPYNTHLILALPSWEYLTSNYNNFYSSFGQGLRNTADKKVSLEIPLNTQMKIFAFLFRENYSESDLFSAIREVGYYGESQTFSINTQTNNLSLDVTLIQVASTGTTDTTPPTASVIAATITTSGNAVVQSTEIGTAYLVKTTVSVSDVITNNTVPPDSQWNSVPISSENINTNLPAAGLEIGTYKVYAEDTAGNVSSPSSNSVTVATNDTTAPTASVTPDNITSSGNAHVQSTETGTAYLVNTAVTVSNLGNITGAADNQTNSVIISLANTDTMLSATGLLMGTYKVYTEDAAGNLSGPSSDNVTIAGLVDIDRNAYSTVVIGTQNWMAENLKVTKYRNGDNITNITTNADWNSNTSGAYGVYDNDETTYLNTYGRLYNWYAVDNSTGVLCPEGWHVPTTDEYDDLATYLGGVSVAGGKMKETGDTYWQSESSGTTNSSGFTARGSGRRGYSNGNYASIEDYTYYWSSNFTGSNGYYHLLTYNGATLGGSGSSANKNYGFSVRCLED
jgi:uncharacterized protein (TIGR02145 family)